MRDNRNTHHKIINIKLYQSQKAQQKYAHTSTHTLTKEPETTEGKRVFLCVFDHWALFAQTTICLSTAAFILQTGQESDTTTQEMKRLNNLLTRQFGEERERWREKEEVCFHTT